MSNLKMLVTMQKDDSPEFLQKELFELQTKAGRRCAYDLVHAADGIRDPEQRELFRNRAKLWLTIFNPSDGIKDYRNRLHRDIFDLEIKMGKMNDRIVELGGQPDEFELPF